MVMDIFLMPTMELLVIVEINLEIVLETITEELVHV